MLTKEKGVNHHLLKHLVRVFILAIGGSGTYLGRVRRKAKRGFANVFFY